MPQAESIQLIVLSDNLTDRGFLKSKADMGITAFRYESLLFFGM